MSNEALTVEENTQLTTLATRIAAIEYRLSAYKKLQEEEKHLKAALAQAMEQNGVKSWEMPDGTKVTLVAGTEPSEHIEEKFDEGTFRQENPDLYSLYTRKEVVKDKGRKSYVRITLRKVQPDGE